MNSGRTTVKQVTNKPPLLKTERVVQTLKKLVDGWGGVSSKKPAIKALRKAKKILATVESGHMPFPTVTAVSNGGIILTWLSLTRDILMTIDTDGDVLFVTSMKRIDEMTFEILERTDSEGAITDYKSIDHIMAWFCTDKSGAA